MPSADLQCDVLIAGFGPVGATLAALLGQSGVSVIVVEPERQIYPLPRAAHIDHEIMRIFQSIGIVDAIQPFIREAPDYEFRTRSGAVLMRVERDGVQGPSGWSVGYNFHQPGVEAAIRDAASALSSVDVRFGARLVEFRRNDDAGIVAAIEIEGATMTCAARFAVGCDGAWSAVREGCGIGLDDYAFDEPWLVIDAKVTDEGGFPPINLQICDPDRPTTFVHMGPGRLRWEFMLKPGEDPEIMRGDAMVQALLQPWRKHGAIEVERRAVYRFHGLVARRWRERSAFIAGDAAHQMPPFLGQGLCSGLRDAANLWWKLATVIKGDGCEALLDSYQAERDPHVRHVIERAIAMGRIVCTLDPARAASRDTELLASPVIAPPAPFPPLVKGCLLAGSPGAGDIFPQPVDAATGERLDDRLGPGAWLVQRSSRMPIWAIDGLRGVVLEGLPPKMADAIGDWLDRHEADAVLVRPDRYVFASGSADALVAAYSTWLERCGASAAA